MPSGASRHCSELPGSSPIPCRSLCRNTSPGPGALPSIGVTRLRRYYGPIRHLEGPAPYLAIPPLAGALTQPPNKASRVALISPVPACCHHYPGGTVECICRSPSSTTAAFPECRAGRLPHHNFRGLLGVHCALRPAGSLSSRGALLTECFNRPPVDRSAATGWNDPCRAGIAPAEKWRLCTAHLQLLVRSVITLT